jgi:hypothetical protein
VNRLNPFACANSTLGGIASSYFDVTTSTSAGPECEKAAFSASGRLSDSSTRILKISAAFAIAAKSVLLSDGSAHSAREEAELLT